MNTLDRIRLADLDPLARHFARFCAELDPNASDDALYTAAWLAERNIHNDTCLDLRHHATEPLLHQTPPDDDTPPVVLYTAPALETWQEALACGFIGAPETNKPLVLDNHRLYLRRHWREEIAICKALEARMVPVDCNRQWLRERLDALIPTRNEEQRIRQLGQKQAAAMALTRKLVIVTGGPGTGKTTTVTRVLALLLEQQPETRIRLAAPTGKAAARLAESIDEQISGLEGQVDADILARIPRKAQTLHRLLGWHPTGFRHNADNPLPAECVLVDEASMIDQGLMASLIDALPEGCRLILLGDRDQLASVEAGSVLGDLTGHGRHLHLSQARHAELAELLGTMPATAAAADSPPIADHIAVLDYSHRFAAGGGIGRLAGAVNAGNAEAVRKILETGDPELAWAAAEGAQPGSDIIDRAVEKYAAIFQAKHPRAALDVFNRARVLTALRVGPWGEEAIGERIAERLRNAYRNRSRENSPHPGLPILVRRNDPETGLFNGDTGIFWENDKGQLRAWFDIAGELRSFSPHQLPAWQPAWSLTVHRSQGSQYDHILLILPPEDAPVLTRELLYTGITRAARHCTLVAQPDIVVTAVDRRSVRDSGLGERLGWN